jgi:putative PIN family toxin of toxin-antitoxin system
MRICLDTNVFTQIFSRRSPFAEIVSALAVGRLQIVVSTEILLEYQEVLSRKLELTRWAKINRLFDTLQQSHGNIVHVDPTYHFNALPSDPDDNKFVDAAVIGQALFIVTYDKHFDPLFNAGYRVQPIMPEPFAELLAGK